MRAIKYFFFLVSVTYVLDELGTHNRSVTLSSLAATIWLKVKKQHNAHCIMCCKILKPWSDDSEKTQIKNKVKCAFLWHGLHENVIICALRC